VCIENEDLSLEYVEDDLIEGGGHFTLLDKVTGETSDFGFSLRYWSGYQGDGQPSGVYLFRPTHDSYDSYLYASISSIVAVNSEAIQQFVISFRHIYDSGEAATARISL
jgi:hypothetical protein